jgi:hypothetical protein
MVMTELKYFKGVKKESTINKRYRELAMKYHPDKAKSEADRKRFHTMMQEINEEHKEVLVLLKYKALEQTKPTKTPEPSEPTETAELHYRSPSIFKNIVSVFELTPEQKNNLINQGRDILTTLYDNIVQNNFKK